MKKVNLSTILGVVIILIGIMILGNNFEWWDFNIFFDGWWTLFIIIPSIIDILKGRNVISSLLVFLVGLLLLFACQDIIMWGFIGKIILPVVIIGLGLCALLKIDIRKIKVKKEKASAKNPNFIGIFSGCSEKVNYMFHQGNCVAIFGGVDLDLAKANIKEDIKIDAVSIFGGIEIKVPKNVDVKANGVAIFGGTEDNVKNEVTNKSPTIYINYTCIFGGIEIK